MTTSIQAEQRVLHLTLKSKWYDMIESGEKPEEYRDINKYWIRRLLIDVETRNPTADYEYLIENIDNDNVSYCFQDYNTIKFARGGHFHLSLPQMILQLVGIKIGIGKPEWGAEPGKKYFVIKLGKKLNP